MEDTTSLPTATCRIDFDARGTLIRVDAKANVEVEFDRPMIAVLGDLQALVDRLKRELPRFGHFYDPTRPVPHPQAYLRASRAAVEAIIAAEQGDAQIETTGQPDVMAAMPALARLLVGMSRKPDGGAN